MPKLGETLNQEEKIGRFEINIQDYIALCYVVDLFDEFTQNLKKFSKGFLGEYKLRSLDYYIKDEDSFVTRDIKSFYFDNKELIESIQKYSDISKFLWIYFNQETGEFSYNIRQAYEYIKRNKKDKGKILNVLYKLNELGLDDIIYENKAFDDLYTYYSYYPSYWYLDGEMEIIPNVSYHEVKYKSTGANYKIQFTKIPMHSPEITLNNFVFDPNNLPENLSYEELLDKILKLKEEKQESYEVLSDAVKLNHSLEIVIPILAEMDVLIENIHKCKNRERAQHHITSAREAALGLKRCLMDYELDLIEQNLITKELLEEENNIYRKNNR